MKKFLTIVLCLVLCLQSCSHEPNRDNTSKEEYSPPPDLQALEEDIAQSLEDLENFEIVLEDASYEITYTAKLKQNNSVGDDWGYGIKHNDEIIKSGDCVTQWSILRLEVTAFAIEYDSYNDRGSANVTFDSLEVGETQTKEVTVIVRENRGRYSGNTAKWSFEITVERIS